ncbi:MAG: hypothetical protein PWP61_77 [Trichococcus sp.]|jgi:hypothetical protein|nr:hypothetical protein [Trichococcus sp.]
MMNNPLKTFYPEGLFHAGETKKSGLLLGCTNKLFHDTINTE